MMKIECSIVRDLLPLYVENMASAETAQYVSEHLKACNECQAELAKLKDGVRTNGKVATIYPYYKQSGRKQNER